MTINVYSTLPELPEPDFPVQVRARRGREDPELAGHLSGFIRYMLSRVEQMSSTVYASMRHLQRVQSHWSLEVEPAQLPAFQSWAERANAICFWPDGSVRDPWGRALVDCEGSSDSQARLPYLADSLARKERVHRQLSARGIALPEHLPPVPGEQEARLREPGEVARRAMALTVVAVRAESILAGDPLPLEPFEQLIPSAFPALSPLEQDFLRGGEQEATSMVWRYEALFTLLWALGHYPGLPDGPCESMDVARLVRDQGEGLLQAPRLRPLPELLDGLDETYRLHWAAREAGLHKQPPPAGVSVDVVMERHHALNWLFRFEEADWDEVDTPT